MQLNKSENENVEIGQVARDNSMLGLRTRWTLWS